MATCNNSLRLLSAIAFCAWITFTASSSAELGQKLDQKHPIGKGNPPGKVVVADLAKKVEAVEAENESPRSLKKKDVITENHTVFSGEASKATLVFSNGSTINVLEKSKLVISEFIQDPFSTPFAMANATEEPTTSTTKLNLKNGEVVCKVKKLRLEKGSSFTVDTPVGAAGVRGTTFAISYLPNQNGTDTGTFTLSVTEGEVSFTDNEGNVSVVPAGKEVVISFRTAMDPVTGESTVVEIISRRVQDIPADRLATIERVATEGDVDAETVVFDAPEMDLMQIFQFTDQQLPPVNPKPVTDANPPANGAPN